MVKKDRKGNENSYTNLLSVKPLTAVWYYMKNLGKIIGGREGYAYNWIPERAYRILDVGCAKTSLVPVLLKNPQKF